MKSENRSVNAKDYIVGLMSAGRYSFTSEEARKALGVSAGAVKMALNRLARRGQIASPARGFYVVIPPEYSSLGCLPADQFISALMKRSGQRYYVGLLSAAQYYGAAHQRPQVFQVMLGKARRGIRCGQVRVSFVVRKRLAQVPVRSFNTPRGTVQVSTPEATAVDLVGYSGHAGGLDQVATVLSELVGQLDPHRLVEAAKTAPITWGQRLGYLLGQVDGGGDKTVELKTYIREAAMNTVALAPGSPRDTTRRDATWKLYINADVEPEL